MLSTSYNIFLKKLLCYDWISDMPELWVRPVCTLSLKWTHQKIPNGLWSSYVLLEDKLEQALFCLKTYIVQVKGIKHRHLKTNIFSAQLCLCSKDPFLQAHFSHWQLSIALLVLPWVNRKISRFHLWPVFMSVPHYSKNPPQVQALQSAHLLLPALFFPQQLHPWPGALKEEILSSPSKNCTWPKSTQLPTTDLPQHATCIQKIVSDNSWDHYLFWHMQNVNVCVKVFACSFC